MGLSARRAVLSCTTDDFREAPCRYLCSAVLGRLLLRYLRERVPKVSMWKMVIVTPNAINYQQSAISPETASNGMSSEPTPSSDSSLSCHACSWKGHPTQTYRGSPETRSPGTRHQVSIEELSRSLVGHRRTIPRSLSPSRLFPTLRSDLDVLTAGLRRSRILASGQGDLLCRNQLRATAR